MPKLYDLCVKVGVYTNQDGEAKNRYLNVGAVVSTKDGDGKFLLIDTTWNPAGVPQEDPTRGNVLVSMFPVDGKKPGPKKAAKAAEDDGGFNDPIPF
jgi:hypothetical protein